MRPITVMALPKGTIDGGPVEKFLHDKLLEWLECLGLLGQITKAIEFLEVLMILAKRDPSTFAFLQEAISFLYLHEDILSDWPKQIYSACLISCPESSLVRNKNLNKIPSYIFSFPIMQSTWPTLLQIVKRHTGPVRVIALSPDVRKVASGSDDKSIKLWETATGDPTITFKGHSKDFNSIASLSDGNLIASASGGKTIKIWNANTGDIQKTLEGHSEPVMAFSFSPVSKHVVSASKGFKYQNLEHCNR